MLVPSRFIVALVTFFAISALSLPCWGQGLLLPSLGPVDRSMGGAGTAAPLDAIGSITHNPATMSALPSSEVSFGMEMLLADVEVSSSIPGIGAGTSSAEPGTVPIPQFGWVHQTPNSAVTYGVAMVGVGGFKSNFGASLTNPVFAPPSNTVGVPGGFGSVFTQANFFEIMPSVSIALTDRLSIGFGPTITTGELILDPNIFAAPDDADGSGVARYPEGRGTRYAWGGGAQAGIYYITDNYWHMGASIRSPQWMEPFRFKSQTEIGLPQVNEVKFDLPMVVSIGAAYSGFERWVFASDVRFVDYKNADGFNGHGFNADGSLRGLGFSSVLIAAVGSQFKVNDSFYLRSGYSYNQSPIKDSETSYNIASSLHYQHIVNAGCSLYVSPNASLNLAYSYLLPSEKSGSIILPTGTIPGSNVTTKIDAHFVSFGVNVHY